MFCGIACFEGFLRTRLNGFCSFLRGTFNVFEFFILLIDDFALRADKHIGWMGDDFAVLISIIFMIFGGIVRSDVGIR